MTMNPDTDGSQKNLAALAEANTLMPNELAGTVTFRGSPDVLLPKQQEHTFGDYELLEEIARGGMGVVFKARQKRLNRLVALKMIAAGELADAEQVKRFYAEAEAAAKLDHSGIVPIYEVGEASGQHFYSMAFMAGKSLNEIVKQDGPLPPRQAAELMKSAAIAVEYAHEHGIIHRDIKPQNILLDERGQPRVTDFGLAKHVQRSQDLTIEGQVMGTPSFMPPEQAKGAVAEMGPRSDVYSLGATLYFLLTARPPFQTSSTAETLCQVIEAEPVPPRRLNPAIPRDLETVCLKCLRKESSRRYVTAAELADDLDRWLAGKPIVARRVSARERAWLWCKRRPAVAAMICVTLLTVAISGIVYDVQRRRTAQERADALADGVLTASADGLPYAIEALRPLGKLSIAHLRTKLDDPNSDPVRRLRAAYALADLGETPLNFLIDVIPTAPAAECRNFVTALEHSKSDAIRLLAQRVETVADSAAKARYAIVALHLGDPRPTERMLALREDPIERTTFIHSYATWHGKLSAVVEMLRTNNDEAFCSGLCAAIGLIPADTVESAVRDGLAKVFAELYINAPDGGTHSTAGWALRSWKEPLPPIEQTADLPLGRRWHVNRQGMTMIEIPAGKFLMGSEAGVDANAVHETAIERPFLLCDREVTIEQFQRFIDDAEYPASEKPDKWPWPGAWKFEGETPDCPVQQVSWYDAVLYCNWLSRQESKQPCYARSGTKDVIKEFIDAKQENVEYDKWDCDFTRDGYRLPSEAEWEYACRATSAKNYCSGDNEELLTAYGWIVNNSRSRTWQGGLKLPNGWGLFDMHGNVWEWCWDALSTSRPRALRGGAFGLDPSNVRSAYRYWNDPTLRNFTFGFRVARTLPLGSLTPLPPSPPASGR
jgi:formylglycine-generating enzyme required for sulfatase activity/tRNA A-37 threonylcarbamoyl transferase component Bud32